MEIYLSGKRVNDELEALWLDGLDALLNNVVPVLVFDALDDATLQLGDDKLLLVQGDALKRLLDHTATVHLEC